MSLVDKPAQIRAPFDRRLRPDDQISGIGRGFIETKPIAISPAIHPLLKVYSLPILRCGMREIEKSMARQFSEVGFEDDECTGRV